MYTLYFSYRDLLLHSRYAQIEKKGGGGSSLFYPFQSDSSSSILDLIISPFPSNHLLSDSFFIPFSPTFDSSISHRRLVSINILQFLNDLTARCAAGSPRPVNPSCSRDYPGTYFVSTSMHHSYPKLPFLAFLLCGSITICSLSREMPDLRKAGCETLAV